MLKIFQISFRTKNNLCNDIFCTPIVWLSSKGCIYYGMYIAERNKYEVTTSGCASPWDYCTLYSVSIFIFFPFIYCNPDDAPKHNFIRALHFPKCGIFQLSDLWLIILSFVCLVQGRAHLSQWARSYNYITMGHITKSLTSYSYNYAEDQVIKQYIKTTLWIIILREKHT